MAKLGTYEPWIGINIKDLVIPNEKIGTLETCAGSCRDVRATWAVQSARASP